MRKVFRLFCVRKEERWPALVALLILLAFQVLVICRYYYDFTPIVDNSWDVFVRRFNISGFDPITYEVVTHWTAKYNVYRHPLLAFFMFIPYLLNQALMALTGVNCAHLDFELCTRSFHHVDDDVATRSLCLGTEIAIKTSFLNG